MKHFLFFVYVLVMAAGAVAPARAVTEADAAAETYIETIKLLPAPDALARQGLHIAYVPQTVKPGGGRYSCGGMTAAAAAQAATAAAAALQKIPAEGWRAIRLKYLLLCSDAQAGGRDIGGIPVPPLQLLMLAAGQAPAGNPRFAYTVLHELYHMIEMQQNSYADARWNAAYAGYDNSYGASAGDTRLGSGGKGFVNGYGKSFPHEERAEIFAIDTLTPDALTQHIAAAGDTALAAKRADVRAKSRQMLGLP